MIVNILNRLKMNTAMTTETKSQFARRISRAPSYITELLSHGRLVLDATGKKINVEASLQRLAETSSNANPSVSARHEKTRQNAPKSKKIKIKETESRAHFKSQVMFFENELLKIEMHLRRFECFDLQDVRREAQSLGNTLRASIERLIDQTAPRLAVMKNKKDRQALLSDELFKLKNVMKSEFPRSLRRMQKKK